VAAVTIRARRARTLRWLMVRDSLTGLYNHAVIMDRLGSSFSLAQRQQRALTIAMVDLDHFKRVNDQYGHAAGDRVLVVFSRLLHQRLRNSDVVGRYGGEEFLVILPDTDIHQARQVIEQVRVAFAAIRHQMESAHFSVTLSAGLADSPRFATASALLEAADAAIYRAKHQGRNRVVEALDPSPAPGND
jgi:diguanylate cyclase (GGDEF)-like protein